MSRQVLGQRWLRRISRMVGEVVVHGSANGTYYHEFTTESHRHGWVKSDASEFGWHTTCPRYTSCTCLFTEVTE